MDSTFSHFLKLEAGSSAEVEGDRFFIRLDESPFVQAGQTPIPYILSTESTSSREEQFELNDCGVHKDDISSEDKYCILDINEMDLLGTEGENAIPLVLEYNVPKETCDYTSFYIPWHFNQPVGEGPRILVKCTVKAEQPEPSSEGSTPTAPAGEESTFYAEATNITDLITLENNCKSTDPGGEPTDTSNSSWIPQSDNENFLANNFCRKKATTCPSGVIINPRLRQLCLFDQSSTENSGLANCCFGTYTLVSCNSREEAGDSTGGKCDNGVDNEWGGQLNECIGGPLRVNNWESTISREGLGDYPIPTIVPSWDRGLKEEFELNRHIIISPGVRHTSNMVIHPQYSSIGIATYYDGIEDLQWESDCSDCPDIFKSEPMPFTLRQLDTNDRLLGYPYFTVECLDGNKDAIHRLHLIIREWNTLEEFYSFKESNGRSGDSDISGREGDECQYFEPDEFGDNDCNDLLDLDDITTLRPYPFVNYDEEGGGGS